MTDDGNLAYTYSDLVSNQRDTHAQISIMHAHVRRRRRPGAATLDEWVSGLSEARQTAAAQSIRVADQAGALLLPVRATVQIKHRPARDESHARNGCLSFMVRNGRDPPLARPVDADIYAARI